MITKHNSALLAAITKATEIVLSDRAKQSYLKQLRNQRKVKK